MGTDQDLALAAIAAAIENYRPQVVSEYWAVAGGDFARAAVMKAKPATTADAYRLMYNVAPFVMWARAQDLPENVEAVFTPDRLDEYLSTGDRREWVSNTHVVARWAITRVGRAATRRAPWKVRVAAPKDEKLSAPYSPEQMDWFREVAQTQATTRRSRYMRAALVLHHGAGLKHNELRFVDESDFEQRDGFFVVRVTEKHTVKSRMPNRAVAVDSAYTEWLRELLDQARGETLAHAASGSATYDPLKVIRREIEVPAALPSFDPRRLRNTWLADMLNRRVPLRAVLAAAGLQTLDLPLLLPALRDDDERLSLSAMADISLEMGSDESSVSGVGGM
ncbi:hypothetical protein EDF42_3720 [Curtobacterium sp. PhB172]|uniref:phage integrase family protein n=1 Tax=Curtobacterium sp. PhB172 TaxID=2485196 RepID=UPI000FA88846|nr:phage integrase family protein [Curtobacterium sp. PhB172]ROS58472.1 hypothetical protein EDF42_3720 [Curtobacterium sp. PhB172]